MLSWRSLTEAGRYRRLRRVAHAALDRYPVAVRRIRLVGGFVNAVYRIDTDTAPLALRIELRPEHTDADTEVELQWLTALAAETDIGVATPIAARDGGLYVRASAEGVPRSRRCTLFTWIGGRPLADGLTPERCHRLGALSAKLHRHGATHRPLHRPMAWDRTFYFPEDVDPIVIDRPEHTRGLSREDRRVLARARDRVDRAFAELPTARAQVVHGDLHPHNVHIVGPRLRPLDFEDVLWAHPAQDIAISLYYLRDRPHADRLVDHFRRGYRTILPWPASRAQIDSFIAARRINFINYMLHSSDRGPAFLQQALPKLARFIADGDPRPGPRPPSG